jgi:acyl dehydratase
VTGRLLTPGHHAFEDLAIGDHYDTGTVTVTAATIQSFADLTGDRFEIHLSPEAAAAHGFPGQVAHGLLVVSLVEGLKSASPVQLGCFAVLHWDWRFRKPVLAGDMISCRISVLVKRAAGPKSGQLTLGLQVTNQRAECVQQGQTRVMTRRDRG